VRERVDGPAYLGLHQAAHLQNPERKVSRSLSYCLERCSLPIALLLFSRTGR